MMKQKASFLWLFIPLTIYLALMTILFFERSGVAYKIKDPSVKLLESQDQPVKSHYTDPSVETLVLFDSSYAEERIVDQNVTETLNSMRVPYDSVDVSAPGKIAFNQYKSVIVAFRDLNDLKQLQEMVDWVEAGGGVFFATYPEFSKDFYSLYRKMGVRSAEDGLITVLGFTFTTDLLPGAKGRVLEGTEEFLNNKSIPLQLEPDSLVHITSADNYRLPLLWQKDFGKGRFVVSNTDQFISRANHGILGAAFSLLHDAFVYPVINSSVYFLDDFPAPVPEGSYPTITKEYQRDTRSFFLDIWWPDMQKLADKYGLVYTGLLIETYNDKTVPPFSEDISGEDHRYRGRLLLKTGGEIGLHGYNHIPLCMKKDGINKLLDYTDWPSIENEQMSLKALNDFGHTLFPGQAFRVYVPPSNVLCPEARAWLPKVLPDLKVISSLLLADEGVESYIQNFEEAPDGIVEFPRVVSGYYLYEYSQLALINELGLHYVNSYFIHPDDILDPERSENRTWEQMRDAFEQEVKWVHDSTPGMRSMTVEEGAAAVQRYYRLKVNGAFENGNYVIHLGSFYDTASLMLRTSREPVDITGGKITKVTSSLYLIQANQPDLTIRFRK